LDYELRGAALSPDGATLHLMSARYPKGQPEASPPLLWTVVDSSGKVVSQSDPLSNLPAPATSTIARGPDAGMALTAAADGAANLLLQPPGGGVRLLRLRRASEAAVVFPVALAGRGAVIQRMLPLSGDRVLLLGSIGSGPLAAVIAANGSVLATYQLRQE